MNKGIDISGYQGEIDFEKVKQSGVDFVISKQVKSIPRANPFPQIT